MSDFKLSTFIVGLIFVSAVAAIFGMMMAEMATTYDVSYDDNESPEIINKLINLSDEADSYKAEVTAEARERSLVEDILGKIFEGGYGAMKTVANSFDVFTVMVTVSMNNAGLGVSADIIKMAILASITIIIFVGIIISVVVRMRV